MRNNRGQVAVVVLLLTALAMSVGLSVSKRTVIDTKLETNTKELKEAFNTADSGINLYIGKGNVDFSGIGLAGGTASVVTSSIGPESVSGSPTLRYPNFVNMGGRAIFWLMDVNADGSLNPNVAYNEASLRMCLNNSYTGAVMLEVVYRDSASGNFSVKRTGFNFVGSNPADNNLVAGFGNVSGAGLIDCGNGMRGTTVNLDSAGVKPVLVTVLPVASSNGSVNGSTVQIQSIGSPATGFPTQGTLISSSGVVGTSQKVVKIEKRRMMPLGLGILLDGLVAVGGVEGN